MGTELSSRYRYRRLRRKELGNIITLCQGRKRNWNCPRLSSPNSPLSYTLAWMLTHNFIGNVSEVVGRLLYLYRKPNCAPNT